ncbi:MAG: TMEM165/GDT1 family protein [Candidatus Nanohaloarchaea archaeon]|nr:TMEM165/GDT1 family protein [Candidatus Nanohaloarchaea archaeon]
MTTGLEALVEQYVVYGPFLAAFLVNILATFGDKGQLVVVTLASRYSARAVFLGAMAAFTLWSGIEVLLGQWIITIISATVMNLITGIIFLLFGIWTLWLGITHLQRKQTGTTSIPDLDDIRPQMGLPGRVLPDTVLQRLNVHGGILTSFFFIMLAEFGDKTQALTITLAGTFPSAPLAVFLGVVSALGIRTGNNRGTVRGVDSDILGRNSCRTPFHRLRPRHLRRTSRRSITRPHWRCNSAHPRMDRQNRSRCSGKQ